MTVQFQQLLPCPFCGGPAQTAKISKFTCVGCADTDCLGFHCACALGDKTKMIEKWNRRVEGKAKEPALEQDASGLIVGS